MDQDRDAERRASERFAMDFKVGIHEIREDGEYFLERAAMRDVSGAGIGFLSRMPQAYRPGQRLHISIILPGTDHLEARLEGHATVVRVGQATGAGTFVGASMDDPLDFISAVHQSLPTDDSGRGT